METPGDTISIKSLRERYLRESYGKPRLLMSLSHECLLSLNLKNQRVVSMETQKGILEDSVYGQAPMGKNTSSCLFDWCSLGWLDLWAEPVG